MGYLIGWSPRDGGDFSRQWLGIERERATSSSIERERKTEDEEDEEDDEEDDEEEEGEVRKQKHIAVLVCPASIPLDADDAARCYGGDE